MLFDRHRPHAFRERRVSPDEADAATETECTRVAARAVRSPALQAYAVHRAQNRTRVITVEAWASADAFRRDADARASGAVLYTFAGAGGRQPTPVGDETAGAIIIDLFPVWRPVAGLVAAFNVRNGDAFNREPGCISTTVLRGLGSGRIATYARWRTISDFTAAFTKITGRAVASTDDINQAAARMTFGLIRPDYHSYDLVAFKGERL